MMISIILQIGSYWNTMVSVEVETLPNWDVPGTCQGPVGSRKRQILAAGPKQRQKYLNVNG